MGYEAALIRGNAAHLKIYDTGLKTIGKCSLLTSFCELKISQALL